MFLQQNILTPDSTAPKTSNFSTQNLLPIKINLLTFSDLKIVAKTHFKLSKILNFLNSKDFENFGATTLSENDENFGQNDYLSEQNGEKFEKIIGDILIN